MASVYNINQNNNYILTFSLVDEDEAPITRASLGTLLLTQYYYNNDLMTSDKYHLATINNRYSQVVFAGGTGSLGVAVSSDGGVTWNMSSSDTAKLSTKEQETHLALFTWQWGGKQNSHEFIFNVRKVNYAI